MQQWKENGIVINLSALKCPMPLDYSDSGLLSGMTERMALTGYSD